MIRLFAFFLGLLAAGAAHAQINTFGNDVKFCSGRPWVDVTCNGADPTGVGDSTTAINTTFNAAITNGWPIFFPTGTYKVTSKITVDYQGIAGNGLEIVSRGAIIDGRTIVSGNVLQFQCSGGTVPAPLVCKNLRVTGQLTVLGTTNAYVVVVGKTDFSDRHDNALIEHLSVVNNSAVGTAGGVQLNYVTGSNLWVSGTTTGGSSSVGAVVLEQVQTSRLGGYASALGTSAPGVLIENGASIGNSITGFEYDPNNNTCVTISSTNARANTWLVPVFGCNTAVNMAGNQNTLLGPSFVGANMGPISGGTAVVGRGSLNRFSAPAASSLTLAGVDDATIFSSANGLGASTQWTAASLPVTLPNPSTVGVGWTTGYVTDNGKAVVLTASAGKILAGDRQLTTLIVGASGTTGFETAVLTSDGTNFRVVHLSQAAAMLNGAQAGFSTRWITPGGPGYQATAGDNGNVIIAPVGNLAVTLPPTNTITSGWMVATSSSGGHSISIQVSSTSGGQIAGFGSQLASSVALPNPSTSWIQFDGANFWVVNSNIPPPGSTTIDNKTAPITPANEGGILVAVNKPGVTAEQIANWVYCNCTNTPFSYDAIRGIVVDNASQLITLENAVAGYVVSNSVKGSVSGGGATSVALLGVGVANANGSNVWGLNTAISDNEGQVVSAGTNKTLYGAELDINNTSPNTTVFAGITQGASLSQPVVAMGWTCGPLSFQNAGILWNSCLQSDDYVTPIGLLIGVTGSHANNVPYPPTGTAGTPSQLIEMNYLDGTPTERQLIVQAGLVGGNGGGFAALAVSSDAPSVRVANIGVVNGGFFTLNSPATNGLVLGTQGTSGNNLNSQLMVLGYTDNVGAQQNMSVFAKGGASPVLQINSTSGTPAIQVGGNIGVSCTVNTPAHLTVVGGFVTVCN